MQFLYYFLIVLITFCVMEGVAWFTHKYIMHKWLWYLHEDHHKKQPGFFEKNDAFFLIFAIPSMFLFLIGTTKHLPLMVCIAAGITLYGAAYFIVHEVIIHQRFKLFTRSDNIYIRSVRWAHKMHHKHLGKEDGESFGMLLVARKYFEKVKNDNKRNKEAKANQ